MVLTDKHLQIATALTFDGGNATVTPFGDTVDFGTNRRIESGKPLYVRCTFTESASAGTGALNAKTEFRFHVAALSSLSNIGAASSVVTVADGADYNLFTLAGHGLVNGSRLNAATSGSLVTTRPYYVINATADTFQISWLPGGVASTALATTNANVTFTPHSECVGSSGPTPIQQTQIGDVIHVALNPTPFNQGVPLARYLFCEVIRTGGTSTAGEVSMALVLDASDYATYYASGFLVE